MDTLRACVLLVAIGFGVQGCETPPKATALGKVATPYKEDALAAIDAIDGLQRRELRISSRTASAIFQSEALARTIRPKGKKRRKPTTASLCPTIGSASAASGENAKLAWKTYIKELRESYTGYEQAYRRAEDADFLNTAMNGNARDHAVDLTIRLLAFAKAIEARPPIFIHKRKPVAIELAALKTARRTVEIAHIESQMLERGFEIQDNEHEYQLSLSRMAIKASLRGRVVQDLIGRYETMTLGEIQFAVGKSDLEASNVAKTIYKSQQWRVDRALNKLQENPDWAKKVKETRNLTNTAMRIGRPYVTDGRCRLPRRNKQTSGVH